MKINNLPTELLYMIIQYLNILDLINLSSVNRLFLFILIKEFQNKIGALPFAFLDARKVNNKLFETQLSILQNRLVGVDFISSYRFLNTFNLSLKYFASFLINNVAEVFEFGIWGSSDLYMMFGQSLIKLVKDNIFFFKYSIRDFIEYAELQYSTTNDFNTIFYQSNKKYGLNKLIRNEMFRCRDIISVFNKTEMYLQLFKKSREDFAEYINLFFEDLTDFFGYPKHLQSRRFKLFYFDDYIFKSKKKNAKKLRLSTS